ncbi:uncharacterized protein LOC110229489 [Arabidopsis lyrata subsp. lyrata]|uniref:uncharacterized protein LOC110229489 n=1 Tax=Arabidopsis lyrata subsp. lyrata TaxID=81972 RepID=UPI000A29DB75|nr:uncharacterized protein LOC110229489 [Arabidopsis lyrata subsp. lyrata]|eukprot:XP_020885482.1 uncharacterized protein LOC110229489 [Arabidopsis lyrata subsp. lyrata]
MASCGKVRDGFSVMGLSGSVGHGDPDMMMPLLTNPWLGLSQFWVSTLIADATSILALRVFFPLHRGVIVRAMMIWFIHGVFSGMPDLLGLVTIVADGFLMQICGPRRIWNPGITSETFVVKLFNDVFGLRCIIGWDYTSTKPNFLMCIMTPIRTNWYWIVGISKLILGTTGFLHVMWSFEQRMPIGHTYHIRVGWLMKKEHNMFIMLASKAYRKEASSNSLFHFRHLQYMAHNSAYVINCFMKFCNGFVLVVIPIV